MILPRTPQETCFQGSGNDLKARLLRKDGFFSSQDNMLGKRTYSSCNNKVNPLRNVLRVVAYAGRSQISQKREYSASSLRTKHYLLHDQKNPKKHKSTTKKSLSAQMGTCCHLRMKASKATLNYKHCMLVVPSSQTWGAFMPFSLGDWANWLKHFMFSIAVFVLCFAVFFFLNKAFSLIL